MHTKRSRPSNNDDNGNHNDNGIASPSSPTHIPRAKRQRLANLSQPAFPIPQTRTDHLSSLPSEILIRILAHLSLPQLLSVSPVSRRFHHLAEDSQLWKALYYARFVLPRAMRIPGFRDGKLAERIRDHKLHYKGRQALWTSGRSGGLVNDEAAGEAYAGRIGAMLEEEERKGKDDRVNWKRQYKIRHNWARGKCAVEELKLGPNPEDQGPFAVEEEGDRSKMLVKVVEGYAITADRAFGLRAWDLKTRGVVAQISLERDRKRDPEREDDLVPPSCIAIDDHHLHKGTLDIALGFADGSFGVWRLDLQAKKMTRRYRHEKSSNGELAGMAYAHPFLLTATGAVLVSLYTFDVPRTAVDGDDEGDSTKDSSSKLASAMSEYYDDVVLEDTKDDGILLPAPYLMTALKSHTSDPPLALSIREIGNTTVASIAYTFYTRRGWSIGIQDLHITPEQAASCAPNITTRLAYTTPITFSGQSSVAPPRIPLGSRMPPSSPQGLPVPTTPSTNPALSTPTNPDHRNQDGPTTLCYSHPYLLATLPDNTLILHLCTSTSSTLSVSPGIRLWGHTSGISDAEITARGKAVSVSSRGEEMRVWELEGRSSGVRSRSVEIRAKSAADSGRDWAEIKMAERAELGVSESEEGAVGWKERRNWVGFDDEMVIVLKEARGGRESLLVYDFT